MAGIVADAGDEEDDADLIVGPRHGPHGSDDFGMLFFDPLCQPVDAFVLVSVAFQRLDVALQSRTELVEAEAGDFGRLDARAFGRLGLLSAGLRGKRSDGRKKQEERKGSHGDV